MRNHFAVTAEKIADPMDYIEDSFSDLNILMKVWKEFMQFDGCLQMQLFLEHLFFIQ